MYILKHKDDDGYTTLRHNERNKKTHRGRRRRLGEYFFLNFTWELNSPKEKVKVKDNINVN